MDENSIPRRRFLDQARNIGIDHFEKSAAAYDQRFLVIGPDYVQCISELLSRLPPDAAILDAACGTGRFFGMLTRRSERLIGVDRSQAMLEQARAKHPDVETRSLPLDALREADEFGQAFDALVCIDSLEWVMRADWPTVAAGFARVLRPGGYAYLTIEVPGEEEARELSSKPLPGAVAGEVRVHYWYNHFPSKEMVLQWTADVGFSLVYELDGEHYWHLILRKGER